MNLWSLILVLSTSWVCWTLAVPAANMTYELSNGILKNVTPGDSSSINLSNLGIESIAANSLDALKRISSLDLSHNPIEQLPPFIFSKLNNLKNLSLANTNIFTFNNTFIGLVNLKYLDLSNTLVMSLERGNLFGLTRKVKIKLIEEYKLFCSKCIRQISTGIFKAPIIPVLRPNNTSRYFLPLPLFTRNRSQKRLIKRLKLESLLKVCVNDGIVESVEDAEPDDDVGNCTLEREWFPVADINELKIESIERIRGFKPKWYRIKNPHHSSIGFRYIKIDDLSPELFKDLPPTITKIVLIRNGFTEIKNNGLKNDYPIALHVEGNDISTIEDGAFENLNLPVLDLSNNKLTSTAFAKTLPMTIRILILKWNKIAEVPLDSFDNLKNLEQLDLSNNRLYKIEPGIFRNLKNLSYIQLKWNKIYEFEPELFQGLDKLKTIDLSFNKIKMIPSNLFERWNSPPTKFNLLLNYSNIENIKAGAFSRMNLNELELRCNEFTDDSIEVGSFNGSHISSISLSSASLTEFDGEWFKGISGLNRIVLSGVKVQKIEKGFAKYMNNVTYLSLNAWELEVLQNGALFGLSTEKDVTISLTTSKLREIEGGLFDDL